MVLTKRYLIKLLILTWLRFMKSDELRFASNRNNGQLEVLNDNVANPQISGAAPTTEFWKSQNKGVSQMPSTGKVNENVSNSIALSILKFAHNIGLQLNQNSNSNIQSECFSPLSIMSALALLLLGAKTSTYQELSNIFDLNYNSKVFHDQFGLMLDDLQEVNNKMIEQQRSKANWRLTEPRSKIRKFNSKESVTIDEHLIKLVNGLFLHSGYSLNLDYKTVATSIYRSALKLLNFAQEPERAKNFINEWVQKNTFGKISNIISGDIPTSTNLILSSTLYFKGFWEQPFFEAATIYDNFYPNGISQPSISVKMMPTGGSFPYYDAKEYGCRIIGLPYKGNLTTMYIIQPYNSSRSKLAELQRAINAEAIETMISKMVQVSALVTFPKMKFSRNFNMKSILMNMGIQNIFSHTLNDLSLIGEPGYNYRENQKKESIQVNRMRLPSFGIRDRYNESPHIFTRFSEDPRQEAFHALDSLEQQRATPETTYNDIFVEDILHKVFIDINEIGTEAAAATVALLFRSGTDVLFRLDTPFIFLIRHDLTKLPIFYGIINEPLLTT